ncbi:HNH endonuclease family protein [Aeromicrobium sp. Leaf350]|uniref:HNH endonuclease family protein n=1 Tax=Aeromicrobium sp. Leaf350 TaxID=2876565 RepID=UPI001E553920|nr:HNH endonuclease family protein [Aeromicrobium sp. Leaf350]
MFSRKLAMALSSAVLATGFVSVLVAPTAVAATSTARDVVASLPGAPAETQGYDRELFQHWIDADSDGCDTRSEVLQAESAVAVTFGNGCTVATGQWTSPYDGATWTQASQVQIDHVVALSEAWKSGAYAWTPEKRRAFANDLDVPYALVAVTSSVNSSKGDRDPSAWLPPLAAARCQYLTDWVLVKYRWSLAVDDGERSSIQTALQSCPNVAVELPQQVDTSNADARWPLRMTAYDGAIYELVNGSQPTPLSYQRWQNHYGFQSPSPAPTSYVRYPWSPAIYAVTFWTTQESTWLWQQLSFGQWQKAGQPAAWAAGWIQGSTYHQWSTSSELFVREPAGITHKLSYAEWQASGFRRFDVIQNQGFQKLSWADPIAHMNNVAGGQGGPITYAMWGGEDFPSPQPVQRFPGDRFSRDACSDQVIYQGPTMFRAINFNEYRAAGSPAVAIDNPRACPPPPSPGGSVPPVSRYDCPGYAPIKGNQSGIYHVPGGQFYAQTTPERCFRTPADAAAAGYRPSQR